MIGRTIRSQPGSVGWSALLLGVGVILAALAPVTGRTELLPIGLLPLAVGVSLLAFGRERPFLARFTEEGMEAGDPPVLVPYDRLRRVATEQGAVNPGTFRKRSCAILVEYDGGAVRIPARVDCPSHEIYAFLAGRIPERADHDVHPALQDYLEREVAQVGPEQIRVYSWSRRPKHARQGRRLRAVCIGAFLAAIVWVALGYTGQASTGWGDAGVVLAVISVVLFLASRVAKVPVMVSGGRLKNACLVIGPRGLAMVQGEVQGEIGWQEVLEIRSAPVFTFLGSKRRQTAGVPLVRLRVKGAEILILDIYDRPLYMIKDHMVACFEQFRGSVSSSIGVDPA